VLRVTYRGKAPDEPLRMLSDKRRSLPAYAKVFSDTLAEHGRERFSLPRR
jgi:hypothetical protein